MWRGDLKLMVSGRWDPCHLALGSQIHATRIQAVFERRKVARTLDEQKGQAARTSRGCTAVERKGCMAEGGEEAMRPFHIALRAREGGVRQLR